MGYYIYAKPETVQVKKKVNWYGAIMRLLWLLILIVSTVNSIMGVCLWWFDITVPVWVCVGMLINLALNFISSEIIMGV